MYTPLVSSCGLSSRATRYLFPLNLLGYVITLLFPETKEQGGATLVENESLQKASHDSHLPTGQG